MAAFIPPAAFAGSRFYPCCILHLTANERTLTPGVWDVTRTADGRVILDVGWTKTILQSGGIVKALSSRSSQRLMEWIRSAGLAEEPEAVLYCPVHRSNKVTAVPTR